MAIATNLPLILYDARDPYNTNVTGQLQTSLNSEIGFDAQDYTYASKLLAQSSQSPQYLPQHLILVYSPRAEGDIDVKRVIDRMLTQAVERKVGSIVIVTASSSRPVAVPPEWASIPTYDAKSYDGNNELAGRVLKETQHVKVPLSWAISAQRSQASSNGRKRTTSLLIIAALVLVLVVIIGGTITGRLPFSNLNRPSSTSENPTIVANATSNGARGTQPAPAPQSPPPSATEQQTKQKDFDKITKSNPTVNGFRLDDKWDQGTFDNWSCTSTDPTYLATIKTANQYHMCLAGNSSYKNFALQVKMAIQGDAGGVIFRSGNAGYYRLSVNGTGDTPAVSLFHCINGQCGANDPNSGKPLGTALAQGDKQSITLTVIARDKNIDVYTDGKLVKSFVAEDPVEAGKIGVHAAALSNSTSVTFSDLKIWSLDNGK